MKSRSLFEEYVAQLAGCTGSSSSIPWLLTRCLETHPQAQNKVFLQEVSVLIRLRLLGHSAIPFPKTRQSVIFVRMVLKTIRTTGQALDGKTEILKRIRDRADSLVGL